MSKPTPWQDRLEEKCRQSHIPCPHYQEVSDRRGGRTAWSSTVTFGSSHAAARFWYDGAHINNAREDAAEVALKNLNMAAAYPSPVQSRHGSSSTSWSS